MIHNMMLTSIERKVSVAAETNLQRHAEILRQINLFCAANSSFAESSSWTTNDSRGADVVAQGSSNGTQYTLQLFWTIS